MKVITRRNLIRDIAKNWQAHWIDYSGDKKSKCMDYKGILARLKKLNLNKCEREEVDDIIGNVTWTELRCTFCNNDAEIVVVNNDVTTADPGEIIVCNKCVDLATNLIKIAS